MGLPPGLSVNTSTGVISGTPTATGTYIVPIRAANNQGTGTSNLTIQVLAALPVVNSASTRSATIGTSFTYTITGTNSPTSFNATGLPAGLLVNTSTGVISGTPTGTAGLYGVTLAAANNSGVGTAVLWITVSSSDVREGAPKAYTIAVGQPCKLDVGDVALDALGLPPGLTVDSAGYISGTPDAAGTFNATVLIAEGNKTVPLSLTITIIP